MNESLQLKRKTRKRAGSIRRLKAIETELKQYKDIEDDLGLDLGIFAKMLKYGGYIKTAFGIEKFKIQNGNIDFKGKLFYVTTEHTLRTLVFKDYGITWALTKNELL